LDQKACHIESLALGISRRATCVTLDKQKVLAISSGGGHWVQLLRLRPAFEHCDVTYACVSEGYRADVTESNSYITIPDATRWNKFGLIKLFISVSWILVTRRPDFVVSTGAAPGYFALRIGKWVGAKTIWLDSIANVEELSLSGKKVGPYADLWLTQWEHLVSDNGPQFRGSVLQDFQSAPESVSAKGNP
jgi:hypothetical protein